MSPAVICHNVANMYAEPDDRSECVSQAILNQRVLSIQERIGFVLIESEDGYQGWVREQHIHHFAAGEPFYEKVCALSSFVYQEPNYCSEPITRLVIGTKLWTLKTSSLAWKQVELLLKDGRREGYIFSSDLFPFDWIKRHPWDASDIRINAQKLIGIPYLWGGTTTFGFDCSGLTQRLYGLWDIILPRDAYLQYESPLGDKLSDGEPYQPGDLVFWVGKTDPRNRGITHVGIMTDETQVIHAYSKMGVVVTPFAEMTSKLGYTYRGAWRYRNEAATDE